MTSTQVVKTSTANNSSFQNYPHPDDHTMQTTNNIVLSNYEFNTEMNADLNNHIFVSLIMGFFQLLLNFPKKNNILSNSFWYR